jgi:hypothetical protein
MAYSSVLRKEKRIASHHVDNIADGLGVGNNEWADTYSAHLNRT